MSATCPVVGKPGRPVQQITVRGLVSAVRLPEVEGHQWFFCAEPDCEVVYFTGDGKTIPKRDLNVHVGIKEKDGPHLVCYCFDHSEESIRKEIEETGKSTVLESIIAKVKNGECRCETMNPKGTCCLGDVSKAVKQAFAEVDEPVEAEKQPSEDIPSLHACCPAEESSGIVQRRTVKGSAGISLLAPTNAGEKQTVSLLVEGMTCEGCAIHLKSALEAVPGVESASVNYEEGRAVVILRSCSDRPPTETLVGAVEQSGYTARPQNGPSGK